MLNKKHKKINELYNQYQYEMADRQLKEQNIVNFLQEVDRLIQHQIKFNQKDNNKILK